MVAQRRMRPQPKLQAGPTRWLAAWSASRRRHRSGAVAAHRQPARQAEAWLPWPAFILWRYVARRFLLTITAHSLLCAVLIFMIDIVELLRQAGKYGRVPTMSIAWMALLRLPAYTEILLPFCVLAGSIGACCCSGASRSCRHAGGRHVGVAVPGAGPSSWLRHRRAGGGGLQSARRSMRGRSPNGCLPSTSAARRRCSRATAAAPGCGRTGPTAHPSSTPAPQRAMAARCST